MQVAKSSRPERVRAVINLTGRRLSSRCKSVAFLGSSQNRRFCGVLFRRVHKQTTLGLFLSFPLFRPQGLKYLPRRRMGSACGGRRNVAPLYARFSRAPRGCSSAGRAPALQAGGQRFESAHLHQHIDNRIGLMRSPECRKAINWILFRILTFEFDVTDDISSAIEEWL